MYELTSSYDFREIEPQLASVLEHADSNDFVVLDIDDTVLTYVPPGHSLVPVYPGMTALRYANFNNLTVFYVTARVESRANRDKTLRDLADVGIYPHSGQLFMRPATVTTWSGIGSFKYQTRMRLESRTGGRCILSVGDQWTDLVAMPEARIELMRRRFGTSSYMLYKDHSGRWSLKLPEK